MQESTDSFKIFVPKLNIFIEEKSAIEAFHSLNQEKENYYKRLERFDSLHLIPEINEQSSFLNNSKIFNIVFEKMVSFSLTLIFTLLVISVLVHELNKSSMKMKEAFVPVEAKRQEDRLLNFKEKLKAAAPYIQEIKKVLNE